MIFSIGLVLLAVFLTGISQILLKKGSLKKKENNWCLAEYLNPYTIVAYAIFLLVTIIGVIALIEVPLKLFYAITSLNFVVVAFLSWIILKEKINKDMLFGIVIIVIGVVIFIF